MNQKSIYLSIGFLSISLLLSTECFTASPSANIDVIEPPKSAKLSALESDKQIFLWREKENYRLKSDVAVDRLFSICGNNQIKKKKIKKGTSISSYYIHIDPAGTKKEHKKYSGEITFDEPILAIIGTRTKLNKSHRELGAESTKYDKRPWEMHQTEFGDVVEVSSDGKSLILTAYADRGADNLRIITAAENFTANHTKKGKLIEGFEYRYDIFLDTVNRKIEISIPVHLDFQWNKYTRDPVDSEVMKSIWSSYVADNWDGTKYVDCKSVSHDISVTVKWVSGSGDAIDVRVFPRPPDKKENEVYRANTFYAGCLGPQKRCSFSEGGDYHGNIAAHEAGHWLGLEDEYPYRILDGKYRPVGRPLFKESDGNCFSLLKPKYVNQKTCRKLKKKDIQLSQISWEYVNCRLGRKKGCVARKPLIINDTRSGKLLFNVNHLDKNASNDVISCCIPYDKKSIMAGHYGRAVRKRHFSYLKAWLDILLGPGEIRVN